MNIIIKWWKRKHFDLRQACIDACTKEFGEDAGKEFGEMYDTLNRGGTIGGFIETVAFLDMIEKVKKESGLW